MKKQKKKSDLNPTDAQFNALNAAYEYFNKVLFNGELPGCILNFSRKKGTHGFLAPYRWKETGTDEFSIHEISLTPTTLHREPVLVFSTLVHEQAHLWQFEFGKPSRNGYHNKEWASKMEEVGLMPSDTGAPDGKKTGQRMTHYIIEGGRYEKAFAKMPKKYLLPFTALDGEVVMRGANGGSSKATKGGAKSSNKKTKYTCEECKINLWGRPQVNILCLNCGNAFEENE